MRTDRRDRSGRLFCLPCGHGDARRRLAFPVTGCYGNRSWGGGAIPASTTRPDRITFWLRFSNTTVIFHDLSVEEGPVEKEALP